MASKKTPEINGGSMADISFLMLIFFLMVTTMDTDKGLSRRLPPMPDENSQVQDIKVNKRNLLEVRITTNDNVYAANQVTAQRITDVNELEQIVIEHLTNPTGNEKLSNKKAKEIEGFGEYAVSEGVISLQNDRGTSYNRYIEVQNVLVRAINRIRDDFSLQNFGKVYLQLNEDQQAIVREAIPQNISEAEPKNVGKK